MASRKRGRRPRGWRGRLGAIWQNPRQRTWAIIGTVVVVAGLLFTWEAIRAYNSIQEADDRAAVLQDNIVEGDVDAARQSFEQLDASTSRAHNSTNGPLWWLGAHVPILGRNVEAVRTVAREIDQVVDEVLPGVVEVADKVRLETYRPKDGKIDLAAVAEAGPVMVRADEVLTDASRDVGAIDPDGLIGPLRTPMRQMQDRFESTAVAASAADDAARLLPGMVGVDGTKRKYLLLVMNNAEVRSLAGMPGSFAVINAKDGKLKMGEQGGIQEVLPLSKPPAGAKLSKDEKLVFQTSIATDIRDTAIHPDFPRTAELAAAIVGKRWKDKYDGVIAIDPVTLGYLLVGIGPVDVGDGVTLNATQRRPGDAQRGVPEVPHGPRQAGRRLRERRAPHLQRDGGGIGQQRDRHPRPRARGDRATAHAVVAPRRRAEAHRDQRDRRRTRHPQWASSGRRVRERQRLHEDGVLPRHEDQRPIGAVLRRRQSGAAHHHHAHVRCAGEREPACLLDRRSRASS